MSTNFVDKTSSSCGANTNGGGSNVLWGRQIFLDEGRKKLSVPKTMGGLGIILDFFPNNTTMKVHKQRDKVADTMNIIRREKKIKGCY